MNYIKKHNQSGFAIDDKVKIKRKAKNNERGWFNSWSIDMDKLVNNEYVIVANANECGFLIKAEDGFYLVPFFILSKKNFNKS